jgi:hypothetical protein
MMQKRAPTMELLGCGWLFSFRLGAGRRQWALPVVR